MARSDFALHIASAVTTAIAGMHAASDDESK